MDDSYTYISSARGACIINRTRQQARSLYLFPASSTNLMGLMTPKIEYLYVFIGIYVFVKQSALTAIARKAKI